MYTTNNIQEDYQLRRLEWISFKINQDIYMNFYKWLLKKKVL